MTAALERQREVWRKKAPRYDREMGFWERVLLKDARPLLCSRAHGEVLEVAVGTGRNFGQYPADVHLVGIDLSPEMLALARDRADNDPRSIDLREGNAHALDFPDASFCTVVCTFAMCNIPNQERALAEMYRVLRSGGRLLLVDHVASTNTIALGVQRVLEKLTLRFQGEHLTRRLLPLVVAAGFKIETHRRYSLGIVEELTARRPL